MSPIVFVDRKHREQSVAHEFQHLAAMRPDRRHLAVEIEIEDIDHGLGRQPVRQRGKAAQIRQPDRGMHGLGVAAPDLAAENPLAGAIADIGVEQRPRPCGAGWMISISRASGGISDRSAVELLVAETARLPGGPARRVNRPVDEEQRQRDIIGDALGAHVVEEWKAPAFGIVERDSLTSRPSSNTIASGLFLNSGESRKLEIRGADGDFGAGPPDEIEAENIGMQRPDEDADAPQRQAGRDQPLAGLRHHRAGLGDDLAPSISQSVICFSSQGS